MTVFADSEAQTKSPSHGFQRLFSEQETVYFLVGAEHNRRRRPTRSEDENTFPSKPIDQLLISHFTLAFSRDAAFVLRPDAAMPRHDAGLIVSPAVSHSPHDAPLSAAASSIWLWTCCPLHILSYRLTGTFCQLGLQDAFSEVDVVTLFCCLTEFHLMLIYSTDLNSSTQLKVG